MNFVGPMIPGQSMFIYLLIYIVEFGQLNFFFLLRCCTRWGKLCIL